MAGGEPGDEAQLLQSSCSTYENKRKEEKTSAITHSRGSRAVPPRECWFSRPQGVQPEHPGRRSRWVRALSHTCRCGAAVSPGLPVTPRHCPVAVPDICITGRSLNRAGSQPIQAPNMEQAFGEPDTLLYGVTASSPASYQLFPHKQNLLYHCRGSCSTSSSTDHLPLLLTVPGSSDVFYPYRTDFASLLLGVAVKHPDFTCSFSWGWWEKVPTAVSGPSTSNPSLFHGWFSWERLQQPPWQLHC